MTEAEVQVKTLAHAGEDALGEIFEVFAEYVAPIVGLIFGWVLGSQIGGAATIGQFTYNLIETIPNASDPTRIADAVGGLVMGGIFAIFGGAMWSASSKFGGKGKKWGSMVAKAVMRFLSGVGFGAAAQAAISGLTGNVKSGWIDQLGIGGAEKAAAAS